MRSLAYYILAVVSAAFIAMFFVSHHGKHVQIGYELTRLRQERGALLERGRQLDLGVSRAAARGALLKAAKRHGLALRGPISTEPMD